MDERQARERMTRLWVEHRGAVVAFVRRRVPNEAVDDVVSETFLVAWRRLEDVPDDARGWLLTVARNVIATHRRTHGRRKALATKVALQPPRAPALTDESAVEYVLLVQAWRRLSDGEREVLALAAWDGLTAVQAAQVLGCRRSTYSVRLSRARKRLLHLLGDVPDPSPQHGAVSPASLYPQRNPR